MGHTLKLNIYFFSLKDTRLGKPMNLCKALEKIYGNIRDGSPSSRYKDLLNSFSKDFLRHMDKNKSLEQIVHDQKEIMMKMQGRISSLVVELKESKNASTAQGAGAGCVVAL